MKENEVSFTLKSKSLSLRQREKSCTLCQLWFVLNETSLSDSEFGNADTSKKIENDAKRVRLIGKKESPVQTVVMTLQRPRKFLNLKQSSGKKNLKKP